MDLIDQHFAAENAHDIPATLATYTDDVVWDDVGHPACPCTARAPRQRSTKGIMDGIPTSIWSR